MAQFKAGDTAKFSKTVSESDIYLYAGITGDFNPAHIDENYAKGTFFKKRIAHGMLLGGFVSNVIAMQLPGPGTIYLSQSLAFKAPVFIGDTVTAIVTVAEVDEKNRNLTLNTQCLNQDGKTIVEGIAVVSPPRRSK
jgi:3-hydroxybutyryl-CoA dehydratase